VSAYFITSSGTGTGKTFVTTALCRELRAQGKKVTALKPVISGYMEENSDTALILQSCGLAVNAKTIDGISPWRFAAPLSPHMAAAREGKTIALEMLVAFCRKAATADTTLLVEGAGGVMAPLNNDHTMLDWMAALGWPVILVGGTYLGAISHMLTALKVLQNQPLQVTGIVISESEASTVGLAETAETMEIFVRGAIPVVKIARNGTIPPLSGLL
jgi:dethiobiotin synthetase